MNRIRPTKSATPVNMNRIRFQSSDLQWKAVSVRAVIIHLLPKKCWTVRRSKRARLDLLSHDVKCVDQCEYADNFAFASHEQRETSPLTMSWRTAYEIGRLSSIKRSGPGASATSSTLETRALWRR